MITHRILFAGAALAGVLSSGQAFAQETGDSRGAYISIQGGLAAVSDVDVAYFDEGGTFGGTGTTDTADFEVELERAFTFGGAIGYDFGMIRSDLEVNYSRNKVEALTLQGINGATVTLSAADRAEVCDYLEADSCGGSGNTFEFDGSRLRQLSALANVWVDLPVGSVVTPYVGGGLGVAGYELDGEGKASFAWQLGAGVAVAATSNLSITFDYRRRQSNGATIEDEDFEGVGVRIDDVQTNIFTAGVRFRF